MKLIPLAIFILPGLAHADSTVERTKLNNELKKCLPRDNVDVAKVIECTQRVYIKADKLLNAVYKRTMDRLKKEDNGEMQELLKKAQLAWISLRDADCNIDALADGGDSNQTRELVRGDCIVRSTLERLPKIERAAPDNVLE